MTTNLTRKQRDNLEMALVMWTAVPPKSVVSELGQWNCGTQACFGGHLAHWEYFIKQGVRQQECPLPGQDVENDRPNGIHQTPGEPYMMDPPTASGHNVAERLFGDADLFSSRDFNTLDGKIFAKFGERIGDHALVLRRIELVLFGSFDRSAPTDGAAA